MSAMSDYLESRVLDHVLGGTTLTPPSDRYLALFTTATSDAGGGTEVTGGSYARQAIAFDAATSSGAANSDQISFTGMPSATVTHCAVVDASTAGNFLFHGSLSSPLTVSAGGSVTFDAGSIVVSIA